MRVKTIKDHANNYGFWDGVSYEKSGSSGVMYDVPDEEAQALIDAGYVEAAGEGGDKHRGAARVAKGDGGTA